MAEEYCTPIVVIPDTPPQSRPQLPQFEPHDDLSQVRGWSTSSSNATYNDQGFAGPLTRDLPLTMTLYNRYLKTTDIFILLVSQLSRFR